MNLNVTFSKYTGPDVDCYVCHDLITVGTGVAHEDTNKKQWHPLHKTCFNTWMQEKEICPSCRAPVKPNLKEKIKNLFEEIAQAACFTESINISFFAGAIFYTLVQPDSLIGRIATFAASCSFGRITFNLGSSVLGVDQLTRHRSGDYALMGYGLGLCAIMCLTEVPPGPLTFSQNITIGSRYLIAPLGASIAVAIKRIFTTT